MVPEGEKEVLEIIRREIGLGPEQEAMWYTCIISEWCVGSLHSQLLTGILVFNRIFDHRSTRDLYSFILSRISETSSRFQLMSPSTY